MHLYSRLYQIHISLLHSFLYRLNPFFLRSPSRSIPSTFTTTIHPFNQPTIIHPFHMTKPSKRTFIYSLIYPFFTPYNSVKRSFLILSILLTPNTPLRLSIKTHCTLDLYLLFQTIVL